MERFLADCQPHVGPFEMPFSLIFTCKPCAQYSRPELQLKVRIVFSTQIVVASRDVSNLWKCRTTLLRLENDSCSAMERTLHIIKQTEDDITKSHDTASTEEQKRMNTILNVKNYFPKSF